VATQWIEGRRLRAEDADDLTVMHIARYLVAVAKPPMNEPEHAAALTRLSDVVFWNTQEALGEEAAQRARACCESSTQSMQSSTFSYGDGRLAPHEWVRTADGQIFKTDSYGHDSDHTIIGKQSVLWDVAGAIIEWDLTPEQTAVLTASLHSTIEISLDTLTFYLLAYAAFRMGQCTFCAGMVEGDERTRLQGAATFYLKKLALFLEQARA
jgi:hypothetical protein